MLVRVRYSHSLLPSKDIAARARSYPARLLMRRPAGYIAPYSEASRVTESADVTEWEHDDSVIAHTSAVNFDSALTCWHSGMFREDYWRSTRMLFAGGFSFANFLMDVLTLFAFVIWFWLAISVFGDLFRRDDMSGWCKALWVIGVILFPYVGVLAYMISQGKGMAERSVERVQRAREELRNVIGFSVADEIEKLDRLKRSGSITDEEFTRLRTKLVKAA